MGERPPLGIKKIFDPLNQPAICFLLLVPIYKHVQIIPPECMKTKNQKKIHTPLPSSKLTPSASRPPP